MASIIHDKNNSRDRKLSPDAGKPVFGVSDQVRHRAGCAHPEKMTGGWKFRI